MSAQIRQTFFSSAIYLLCECGRDVYVDSQDSWGWTTCECGRKYSLHLELLTIEPDEVILAVNSEVAI